MNKLNLLTPELLSDISPYDVFLDNAIKDPRIKNVAITGRYGAGKSTIIDSFIDLRHKDSTRFESDGKATTYFKIIEKLSKAFNKLKKYINSTRLNSFSRKSNLCNSKASSENIIKISLAKFTDDKNDTIDSKILESEILRQILNQVQSYKIPLSNLKWTLSPDLTEKKINRSILKILFYGIILFWCSINNLIQIIKSNISSISEFGFINFVSTKVDWYNFITILNIISVSFLVILSYSFLKKIFYMLSSLNLSKIGFKAKGLEVELASISDSLLNKYVAELVYVFNQNSTTVVIFEDLDRFQKLDIFSKLRYLCLQLNNNCELNQPLTFIYAIDDSLFTNNEERTKFFDLIIPVVSFLNESNSSHIFEKLLSEYSFPKGFINDISPYICDIRVVKNIANEFIVYNDNRASKNEQNFKNEFSNASLFALMCLKNILPNEFSNLYSKNGLFYKIFIKGKLILFNKINEIRDFVISDQMDYPLRFLISEYKFSFQDSDDKSIICSFWLKEIMLNSGTDVELPDTTYFLLSFFIEKGYFAENYYDFLMPSSNIGLSDNDIYFIQSLNQDKSTCFNFDLNINPMLLSYRICMTSDINKPIVLNHDFVKFIIYGNEDVIIKKLYEKTIRIFKYSSEEKSCFLKDWVLKNINPEGCLEKKEFRFIIDVLDQQDTFHHDDINDVLFSQPALIEQIIENEKQKFVKWNIRFGFTSEDEFLTLKDSVRAVILENFKFEINNFTLRHYADYKSWPSRSNGFDFYYIIESKDDKLIKYISDNINEYYQNVYGSCDALLDSRASTSLFVLLDKPNRIDLIKKIGSQTISQITKPILQDYNNYCSNEKDEDIPDFELYCRGDILAHFYSNNVKGDVNDLSFILDFLDFHNDIEIDDDILRSLMTERYISELELSYAELKEEERMNVSKVSKRLVKIIESRVNEQYYPINKAKDLLSVLNKMIIEE